MKRILIFLGITFSLTWVYEFGVVYPISSGGLAGIPDIAAQLSVGAAMFFPAIGVVLTRLITKEGFKNSLIKPRGFKKSLPWFLLAWVGPSAIIAVGAVIYYLMFPGDFDPSMSTLIATTQQQAAAAGATDIDANTLRTALIAQLAVAVVLGPVLNIFTTFGEEWGWRGYLTPKMSSRLSIVPTMLITGVIWGLWHAPIIALGHNYGLGYPGWPFSGIAAMCVFCTVWGIFLTYVTERTGSCLAAAFGHGAINSFVRAGTLFSLSGGNPFIGPLPTGIVGGCISIVVATWMLWDMHRREKAGTFHLPQAGLPDGISKEDAHANAEPIK